MTFIKSTSKLPTPDESIPSRVTHIKSLTRNKQNSKTQGKDNLADSTTSRVSYTLDSSIESVNKIEQTAELCAVSAGFDEDAVSNISMAIREAAVNAVLHGNAYDANKTVKASFETTVEALTIRICDQGPGLDPDTIPDPLAPENILRGSGRGIFLMRAFMDEVKFRQLHPGTELTLIKHRPQAQSDS